MILCKHCGYEGAYVGKKCPSCGALFALTAEEIANMEQERREALASGEVAKARELAHLLADAGVAAAAYAHAVSLQGGEGAEECAPAALPYFEIAAKGGDAKGAYVYGCALARAGRKEGDFFLQYAALLGCTEAYAAVANFVSDISAKDRAAYLALTAEGGDASAALTLAKLYAEGAEGIEPDPALAKFYLNSLGKLPGSLWRLAFRLRKVAAKQPPKAQLPNAAARVASLFDEAQRCGYKAICLSLCQMQAGRGDAAAQCRLGLYYIRECRGAYVKKGVDVLNYYGRAGNTQALVLLGDLYRVGDGVALSRADAIACYNAAREQGSAEACVRLGDVYSADTAPNVPYAYLMYKEALALGSAVGKEKAQAIEERREALYDSASAAVATDPEDAYRDFALSASMGYLPAAVALGFCYEEGIGVRMDRRRAFLWYERAAKEKEEMAQYRLALCYLHGIGINRSFKKAHALLRRAAAAGIEEAGADLLMLMERRQKRMVRSLYSLAMRLLYQGKRSLAFSMLSEASALGHARATYALGCFYEFGVGTPASREQATATYQLAQQQGYADPRAKCKSVILKILHAREEQTV